MSTTTSTRDDHLVLPTIHQMIEAHLVWVRANFAATTAAEAGRFLAWVHAVLPFGLPGAREEWDDLFARHRNDWAPRTRATYLRHARRFFRWATDEDDQWLQYDPTAKLVSPRVHRGKPRPATEEQTRIAVTRLPAPFLLHARLAAYAGLRCMEVAQLRREDMTEHEIRVTNGKGEKPDILPMHPVIWETVRDMPDGLVTAPPPPRRGNRPIPAAGWVSWATRYQLRKAGAEITMHQLRHRYVTMIQRTYRDAAVTRRLARHESWQTTQVYVEIADESARAAVAGLPDLTAP